MTAEESPKPVDARCPPPKGWDRPDPKRMVAWVESLMPKGEQPSDRRRGSSWNFTHAVSPLDLYSYLKVRFGEPNGFMMMLKSPSVDNFCHWHYTLEGDGTIVDLMGLNVRTQIRVYERLNIDDAEWLDFEAQLQEEFTTYRAAMKKEQLTFERWHLFINPY